MSLGEALSDTMLYPGNTATTVMGRLMPHKNQVPISLRLRLQIETLASTI